MKCSDMRRTYKVVLAAFFLSLGLVLPFVTGQIPQIGKMLLPMHLPVFFCAFLCGWQYGAAVGLILPVFRSAVFGMPLMFPDAVAMSAELATYGLVAGLIYGRLKQRKVWTVYAAMLPAMLLGRVIWGAARVLLLGVTQSSFTWQMFLAGGFVNAVPGIVLQLLLVPGMMTMLHLIQAKPQSKRNGFEYEYKEKC